MVDRNLKRGIIIAAVIEGVVLIPILIYVIF